MPNVAAVVFEGGPAADEISRQMAIVRQAVVLDNLEKMASVAELDQIILCTDRPGLASEAAKLGATVDFDSGSRFQFGRRLAEVIRRYRLSRVIYMGGASAPLITREELAWIAQRLVTTDNVVIMNNVQSADVVAFAPAKAIEMIGYPENDNFLGYLLREAGLERILIPNSSRVNFDLDTPNDLAILSLVPWTGPRTCRALTQMPLDLSKLKAAQQVLRTKGAELGILGRVGAPVIAFINSNFAVRLRVFSEERGMKAMGREEAGLVTSLIGRFIDEVGPVRFFDHLAGVVDAAFYDTRVYFAHLKKWPSDSDRFHSDLGDWEKIEDPQIRDFTRAAVEAPIPIVLGGHSLVAGGLWVLAEGTVLAEGREVRYLCDGVHKEKGV
ncbi:MAG: hypothetical protein AB1331_02365 [Bacillota bacterium]